MRKSAGVVERLALKKLPMDQRLHTKGGEVREARRRQPGDPCAPDRQGRVAGPAPAPGSRGFRPTTRETNAPPQVSPGLREKRKARRASGLWGHTHAALVAGVAEKPRPLVTPPLGGATGVRLGQETATPSEMTLLE